MDNINCKKHISNPIQMNQEKSNRLKIIKLARSQPSLVISESFSPKKPYFYCFLSIFKQNKISHQAKIFEFVLELSYCFSCVILNIFVTTLLLILICLWKLKIVRVLFGRSIQQIKILSRKNSPKQPNKNISNNSWTKTKPLFWSTGTKSHTDSSHSPS